MSEALIGALILIVKLAQSHEYEWIAFLYGMDLNEKSHNGPVKHVPG